jgi:hypothetical protein
MSSVPADPWKLCSTCGIWPRRVASDRGEHGRSASCGGTQSTGRWFTVSLRHGSGMMSRNAHLLVAKRGRSWLAVVGRGWPWSSRSGWTASCAQALGTSEAAHIVRVADGKFAQHRAFRDARGPLRQRMDCLSPSYVWTAQAPMRYDLAAGSCSPCFRLKAPVSPQPLCEALRALQPIGAQ